MNCRACGAEIAEKAIVCYRCGAPTAAPAPASASTRRRPPTPWGAVVLLVVLLALATWLIPQTEPGSSERIAAWAVTWLGALGAVAWFRRGRRR